jgi:hypothetical protein
LNPVGSALLGLAEGVAQTPDVDGHPGRTGLFEHALGAEPALDTHWDREWYGEVRYLRLQVYTAADQGIPVSRRHWWSHPISGD